jgi:hypothetical protein
MARFRAKPIEIDAEQFPGPALTGEGVDRLISFEEWLNARKGGTLARYTGARLELHTPRGQIMQALPGDWVLQDKHGELYVWPADEFNAAYEPMEG